MQTLKSLEMQSDRDWEICIVYDAGDGGEDIITEWCAIDPARRKYVLNDVQMYAPHNQFLAIEHLAPADDDIVVFLDLDGDMLAHPAVLEHVRGHYYDDTLLTYGSYASVPPTVEAPRVLPFPPDVVQSNSYRSYILYGGPCCFNHLRTMKGKVIKAISPQSAHWPDGKWFISGGDYLIMISGLELAGGRYKVISEVLLHYNNANELADNLSHPTETTACNVEFLKRPPLNPLGTS